MKPLLAALLLCVAAGAQAQYPDRPIKLVVPFTPGTGIDILALVFAQKLQERMKTPVVVENRPGASGNIGTEAVAKAPADGYTLLVTATTLVQSAVLFKSVPYDPKALTPVGLAAIGNLALVAHPSVPARTVGELVALAKAQPGKLNYASPGNATPHHLAMELLKLQFGLNLVHVPSLAESGVKDIDVDIWYALLGPAGLPGEVVQLLNRELVTILRDPETRAGLLKQGLSPATGTPAELAKLIEADLERWGRVVREARISAD